MKRWLRIRRRPSPDAVLVEENQTLKKEVEELVENLRVAEMTIGELEMAGDSLDCELMEMREDMAKLQEAHDKLEKESEPYYEEYIKGMSE